MRIFYASQFFVTLLKTNRLPIYILALFVSFFGITTTYSQTQKTNLPAVYITTDGNVAVTSKEDYLKGRIKIVSSDASEKLDTITEIRGRGNSTWDLPKKPYRIKLDKKYNVFNLPAKAKSWTLLANYADKTLMRNALAFKISNLLGLEFTPSAKFVDLTLNGQFLGNYMLSDQVEVNSKRVNIDELDATVVDTEAITGGYLLEIDGFAASEPVWFTTDKGLKITVKSPDDDQITSQQLAYIQSYIAGFENRLFSADFKDPTLGYRAKVDTTSLINWYIGCELTGNSDSFWSTYIYKKRSNDKLFFGPMWDYDIAFNNDSRLGDAANKLMRNYAHNPRTWIEQLYKDEWFQEAVWKRWTQLVNNNLETELNNFITSTATLLDQSQQLNFSSALWPILNKKVYQEQFLFTTYAAGVDYLKQYVKNRITFLNTNLKYVEPEKASEPFVADDNYYYMILNKKTNNAIAVSGSSLNENAALVSWEPINSEDSQLWDVTLVGNDTYRLINKKSGLVASGNGYYSGLTQKAIDASDSKQLWKIVPVNTGNVYALKNASSGYTVNNSGGNLTNGNPIIEYTSGLVLETSGYTVSSENQQWYIQKLQSKTSSIWQYGSQSELNAYFDADAKLIYVNFSLTLEADVTIAVYNLFGQQVYRNTLKNVQREDSIAIPASSYESGVYLLKFSTSKGDNITQKLIIKK
jgi:CotH kinase protein/Ricin-type beta-trefoil lectin domain-like/Secretion system C-terminal sorting domain